MTERGNTRIACRKVTLIECMLSAVLQLSKIGLDLHVRVTLAAWKQKYQHLFTHTTYFLSAYHNALPCNNQYRPTFYGTRS